MISAPELAELIGRHTLKQVGKTTWLRYCPKCITAKPHFYIFDFDSHGMFKCHSCGWCGNEVTWRQFTNDNTPVTIDRQAIKNDARERAEALFRVRARSDAAMPEEDIFTDWQKMATARLGWKLL